MTSTDGGRPLGQIVLNHRDVNAVRCGVEPCGDGGQRIDVRCDHACRAGLDSRDGDKAGAGAEVEHAASPHDFRMGKEMAGECYAACPGIGPVGRMRTASALPEKTPEAR